MANFLLGVGTPLNYYLDAISWGGSKAILPSPHCGDVGQYTIYEFFNCQRDY